MEQKKLTDSCFQEKPIRVLQVTGRMNRGGAETMLMNIYRNIDRSKVQFDFVSFSGEGHYDSEIHRFGGNVFYVDLPKGLGPLGILINLVKLMKEKGPYDIVHAHTLHNIGIVLLAARIVGIKVRIAHSHSTQDAPYESLVRKLYHRLMGLLIKINATCYLACGKEAGKYLFGKAFSNKGIVLPNAVEIEKFIDVPEEEIKKIKYELKIEENMLTICHIARMSEVKNHIYSLKIAKELARRNYNFRMFFIGDGVLREKLEKEVKENNLENRVIFLGVRDDIPKLLKACDVFLMPSLFEGLPVALIEAQAAGIHCVVSNTITSEADMGIGLVNYVDLKDPIETWVDAICRAKNAKRPKKELIHNSLTQKGYNVKTSVENIVHIYVNNIRSSN